MTRVPRPSSTVLATLLLSSLFSSAASAQPSDIPMGKWWKRPRVVEALHLTSEQQGRLEDIFSKNRRSFIDLRAEVERRHVDVEELMAKKDSDPRKVSAAVDALEQAKLRLGKARTMMILEMREILTAEQWKTVVDRMEEWRRERTEGRRMGRRGPGQGSHEGTTREPHPEPSDGE